MIKNSSAPYRRHNPRQDRAIRLLLDLHGSDACRSEQVVPSLRRPIDLLVQMRRPSPFWGPLAVPLSGRTVGVEFVSGRLASAPMVRALWKLVTLSDERLARRPRSAMRQHTPMFEVLDGAPPACVIIANSVPAARLSELPLQPLPGWQTGLYTFAMRLAGELYVVDLRSLPITNGTHALHLLAWADDEGRYADAVRGLLGDTTLVHSEKRRLMETIMNLPEEVTQTEERRLSFDAILELGERRGKAEGRREALLSLLPPGLDAHERAALLEIEDSAVLAARVREESEAAGKREALLSLLPPDLDAGEREALLAITDSAVLAARVREVIQGG